MTYEELLQKCLDEGRKVKDDEIVASILTMIDTLQRLEFENLDERILTRAAGKLSIYLVNLGQLLATASLGNEGAHTYRKMKGTRRRREVRPTTSTIADAEALVEESLVEDYERELANKYAYECLKNLYESVSTLISVLQSRTKTLNTEKMRSASQL